MSLRISLEVCYFRLQHQVIFHRFKIQFYSFSNIFNGSSRAFLSMMQPGKGRQQHRKSTFFTHHGQFYCICPNYVLLLFSLPAGNASLLWRQSLSWHDSGCDLGLQFAFLARMAYNSINILNDGTSARRKRDLLICIASFPYAKTIKEKSHSIELVSSKSRIYRFFLWLLSGI